MILRNCLSLVLFATALVAQPLAPRQIEPVFDGREFDTPVFLTHAGDGSNRIFIVEQGGVVRVLHPESNDVGVFIDHSDVVRDGGERGLLGLAFHPQHESNGLVYLSYTHGNLLSRVSEFAVSDDDADVLSAASERVLLDVPQPASNHNGGQIDFGPDGMLYVALGDGGASNDRFQNGQDPTTLLGTFLRIDVDSRTGDLPYGIPADNPFVGNSDDWRTEIWAWGLRNPWRFSFDLVTGDLWTGDVGQNRREEIDIIVRGGNYGWNRMEGFECFQATECSAESFEAPVLHYDRNAGISVTGGYVYRGQRLGDLVGTYVYADFGSGNIWGIRYDGSTITDSTLLIDSPLNISSFGEDEAGELYIVDHSGPIFRFAALPGEQPVATAVTDLSGATPTSIQLDPNAPNPFNPSTVLRFSIDAPAAATLRVFDMLGRPVRTLHSGWLEGGSHRVVWDGRTDAGAAVAAGIYIARLQAGSQVRTQRMALIK